MARDFNGSSDRLRYTLASAQTDLAQVSFSHWVNWDTGTQYRRSFHLGPLFPADQIDLEFDDGSGGLLMFNFRFSSARGSWSITEPSSGTLYHIAITFDASSDTNDPLIYLNGVSQTVTERNAPSGTRSNTSTDFYLGSETSGGGQYWDGRISEFGMWNKILTAGEVAALAKGFSPLFFQNGLVFYDPLNRNLGDRIKGIIPTETGTTVTAHPKIIYPSINDISTYTAQAPVVSDFLPRLSLLGVG